MAKSPSLATGPQWAQRLHLDPTVVEAFQKLDKLVIDLRFAQALRRNWEACRAEAAITSAAAGARLDGVQLSNAQLRVLAVRNERGQSLGWAYWRAHVWVSEQWEPLNARGRGERPRARPRLAAKARAAKIHALLAANQIGGEDAGADSVAPQASALPGLNPTVDAHRPRQAEVAIPSDPQAWQQFENLLHLPAPAPIRCGLAMLSALRHPFFSERGTEVARVMVRDELTSSGFEPTGTWQWMPTWEAGGPALTGNPLLSAPSLVGGQVNEWLAQWMELMLDAHQPTRELLRRVQAGQLS